MRAVVQQWNEKYHVQFSWGPLEQTFRVPQETLTIAEIETFARALVPEVEQIFLKMAEARKTSLESAKPPAI